MVGLRSVPHAHYLWPMARMLSPSLSKAGPPRCAASQRCEQRHFLYRSDDGKRAERGRRSAHRVDTLLGGPREPDMPLPPWAPWQSNAEERSPAWSENKLLRLAEWLTPPRAESLTHRSQMRARVRRPLFQSALEAGEGGEGPGGPRKHAKAKGMLAPRPPPSNLPTNLSAALDPHSRSLQRSRPPTHTCASGEGANTKGKSRGDLRFAGNAFKADV